MKRLPTQQLVPGMVVADDVMNSNHQLILSKDTVLTDALIMKLDLYGVLTIHVKDKILAQPESQPAPTGPSYFERVKKSPQFQIFKKVYEEEVDSFKGMLNNVVEKNTQLDVKELLSRSLMMVTDAHGHISILDMLHNMREYDDSTFAHCLNVGLICNVFAHWLQFSEEDIEMVTACGLLHDVGKLLVPRDLITKPGKLTDLEYYQVKKHSFEGYQLLMSQNIDKHICNAALMHHERCETEGLQRYDVAYVLRFLENIVDTYIQNRCRLSDGREGTIIFINKPKLSRPVVQCGDIYVNLAEEPDLCIDTLL